MKTSNDKAMTYSKFKEHVLKHLEEYKIEVLGIEGKGTYKYQGKDIPEGQILPLDSSLAPSKAKERVVVELNQLECIKKEPFLIAEHLHRYAHHLNSSQLMCYNFFRPYIIEVDKPTQDLIKLVSHIIEINLCDDAKCQFEYVNQEPEWKDEGTNFDFYLESGGKKIYFEIKYTEKDFGGCNDDEDHKNKFEGSYKEFEGGYKKKIVNCPAIKERMRSIIEFDEEFRKNYQLFRNVIRVINHETYSVFIYDKRNNNIDTLFNDFRKKYISDKYKKNVIAITWQELAKDKNLKSIHREQFYKKYLE